MKLLAAQVKGDHILTHEFNRQRPSNQFVFS